jgi:hypothetical protein
MVDLGECNRVLVLCTHSVEQAEKLWRVAFFYSYLELEAMKFLGQWEGCHLFRHQLNGRPYDR